MHVYFDTIKKHKSCKALVDWPGFEPLPLQYDPSALYHYTTIPKKAGIKVKCSHFVPLYLAPNSLETETFWFDLDRLKSSVGSQAL